MESVAQEQSVQQSLHMRKSKGDVKIFTYKILWREYLHTMICDGHCFIG